MKITICGSIAFYDQMIEVKQKMEVLGHEVRLPPNQIKDANGNLISVKEYYDLRKAETDANSWIWDRKAEAIKCHNEKIAWADAILVLNYDKRDIANYIGANTLMEMGLAFFLNKKIFLLNSIPEISYKEEILGVKPIVIVGDLTIIS